MKVETTILPDGYTRCASYTDEGQQVGETWSLDALPDRTGDLPAKTRFDVVTGAMSSQWWCSKGALHRLNGPAAVSYDPKTGKPIEEQWFVAGRYQRADGPTHIRRDGLTGTVTYEEWTANGETHRIDAPAVIYRNAAGDLLGEEWWQDGKLTREERYRPFTKHYPNAPWSLTRFDIT